MVRDPSVSSGRLSSVKYQKEVYAPKNAQVSCIDTDARVFCACHRKTTMSVLAWSVRSARLPKMEVDAKPVLSEPVRWVDFNIVMQFGL